MQGTTPKGEEVAGLTTTATSSSTHLLRKNVAEWLSKAAAAFPSSLSTITTTAATATTASSQPHALLSTSKEDVAVVEAVVEATLFPSFRCAVVGPELLAQMVLPPELGEEEASPQAAAAVFEEEGPAVVFPPTPTGFKHTASTPSDDEEEGHHDHDHLSQPPATSSSFSFRTKTVHLAIGKPALKVVATEVLARRGSLLFNEADVNCTVGRRCHRPPQQGPPHHQPAAAAEEEEETAAEEEDVDEFLLLLQSPINQPLWNRRKHRLLMAIDPKLMGCDTEEGSHTIIMDRLLLELRMTSGIISVFPKCPEGWTHRTWVLGLLLRQCRNSTTLPGEGRKEKEEDEDEDDASSTSKGSTAMDQRVLSELFFSELMFVEAMIEAHPRNYPGWQYRAYVREKILTMESSPSSPSVTSSAAAAGPAVLSLRLLRWDFERCLDWVSTHTRDFSAVHYLLTAVEPLLLLSPTTRSPDASVTGGGGESGSTSQHDENNRNKKEEEEAVVVRVLVEWMLHRLWSLSQRCLRWCSEQPDGGSENGFLLRRGVCRLTLLHLKKKRKSMDMKVAVGSSNDDILVTPLTPLVGSWTVEDELRLVALYTDGILPPPRVDDLLPPTGGGGGEGNAELSTTAASTSTTTGGGAATATATSVDATTTTTAACTVTTTTLETVTSVAINSSGRFAAKYGLWLLSHVVP